MKKILVLFVFAAILAVLVVAHAPSPSQVPAGFIAVSKAEMTMDQAEAYCRQQGGRLPLIGGRASQPYYVAGDNHIDGFGESGDPWPAGLPRNNYWIGTAYTGDPSRAWIVLGGAEVSFGPAAFKSGSCRVACIPLQ
jgi:hypothetical protein